MRRSALLFDADNLPTSPFASFLRDIDIPGTSLAEIDEALQARFFQKNADGSPKERWQLDAVQVNCSPNQIKQHLAVCGFMNETKPVDKTYTYAAWPGALVTRAVVRLNNLVNAWNGGVRWEQTIIFAGKRPLQDEKENYEACCKVLSIDHNLPGPRGLWDGINPQTELDMMRFVWRRTILPHSLLNTEAVFIDTPMIHVPGGELDSYRRPTTEDTVLEWLKSDPKPGSVLLSSGAPYGMAMDEAFWMLLKPHGFTVETFGHAAPDLPIENLMREVAGTVNRIKRARIK